jgi:methyl-accepting chemotaxis protein
MSMSRTEIKIIKNHWKDIKLNLPKFSQIFYQRLFEKFPNFRPLFTNDINRLEDKLIATLDVAVLYANKLELKQKYFKSLGQRHIKYGVTDDMYEPFLEVLLEIFKEYNPTIYNSDLEKTWIKIYNLMVNLMLN